MSVADAMSVVDANDDSRSVAGSVCRSVVIAPPTCLKEFKAPAPRPSSTPRVALKQTPLPEEMYTSALQRIVERDYFPELPYLRAKQALDDAIQTRDPQRIRVAYAELRRCAKTPSGRKISTPARRMSTDRLTAPGTPGSFTTDHDGRESVVAMDADDVEEDPVEDLVSCFSPQIHHLSV
jgi:hypothetical protein